jgi:hypothetical protein
MKQLKIIIGALLVAAGCGLAALSIWCIAQGKLAWISFVIVGLGLALAGTILITHKSVRDFWEALRDIFGV